MDLGKLANVAAPPTILSVLPKGVSMASNATVPITTKLMNKYFKIFVANIVKICTEIILLHSQPEKYS